MGEDELKNKSSHRVLPLIPQVEQVLLQAREQQELYRKKFGRSWCSKWEGYICLLPDGEIITPNFLTAHFGRLLKKHNLPPIRFHDLRHTCASLLVQAGVSMKQVQLWMGHSDFSTTADIYAHLAPGALVESAGVLGSLLGEEPAETTSENWKKPKACLSAFLIGKERVNETEPYSRAGGVGRLAGGLRSRGRPGDPGSGAQGGLPADCQWSASGCPGRPGATGFSKPP